MDITRIEAHADYISMDLANRVLTQSLSITEAMYSLVVAMSFLLSRTLPKEAFDQEYEDSKALAHKLVTVLNQYIRENEGISTARVILSLSLLMELVMEERNQE
jgi:hypothetical protein